MSGTKLMHRTKDFRHTQRGKLLAHLQGARGQWVPLPEILRLGIAQYGARVLELRRAGYVIENKTTIIDGQRHSWFRLLPAQLEAQP